MQSLSDMTAAASPLAMSMIPDMSQLVTECCTVEQAEALPPGAVVGDQHGGLTFTDAVAAALESRSIAGWQERQHWTVIVINR